MHKAKGWNPTGFFPTPHEVVECMVRLMLHDTQAEGCDPRTASVTDPCVGSGRMLLHASNYSLSLWGQGIDALAVAMCKVNGVLYAPWLSLPFPAAILGSTVVPPRASLLVPDQPWMLKRLCAWPRMGQSNLAESPLLYGKQWHFHAERGNVQKDQMSDGRSRKRSNSPGSRSRSCSFFIAYRSHTLSN